MPNEDTSMYDFTRCCFLTMVGDLKFKEMQQHVSKIVSRFITDAIVTRRRTPLQNSTATHTHSTNHRICATPRSQDAILISSRTCFMALIWTSRSGISSYAAQLTFRSRTIASTPTNKSDCRFLRAQIGNRILWECSSMSHLGAE